MIQRTHDLGAVVFVSYGFLSQIPVSISWETLLGVGIFTILGATLPDIDNVTSPAWRYKLFFWERKMTQGLLGGHRHLSHSLLGGFLFYIAIIVVMSTIKLSNLNISIIGFAFILSFLSHLILDSLTSEGVPWLYPIRFHFGFPPFKFMRIKTGGLFEKIIIFPALLIILIFIYYNYRQNLVEMINLSIK